MKYFSGMDMSLEETAIFVVDETGRVIEEARAASYPLSQFALSDRSQPRTVPVPRYFGTQFAARRCALHGYHQTES